jgi:hypothetical protein
MRGRAATALSRLRAELDRSLFPTPAPGSLRFGGREGAVVCVCFLFLAAGLQFLRAGAADSPGALFAEDGPVYLGEALDRGFFDSLTSTYAGYLVLLPRLIGEIATIPPLRYAPVTMNVAAVLLVAFSGLAVWVGSAGLIRTTYLRMLLVALVLLPPTSGLETVVSATNVAWYTSFAVFWLLLWRPAATWSAALGGLMILLSGLSSPIVFFFVPVAALRTVVVRDRRDGLIAGAFWLALAIQLPVTALSGEDVSDPTWTANILTTFLQRVVAGLPLGLELGGDAWVQWGRPFLIAICVAVAAFFAAAAWRASSGRLLALLAVVTSLVMFLASGYTRSLGDVMVWPTGAYNLLGARYAMIPGLLLASAALVLLDGRVRSGRGWAAASVVAGVVLLGALVTSFGGDAHRQMPSWSQSVRQAAARCHARDSTEERVFITPEGWSMTLPCQRLESDYRTAPAG